MESKLMSKQYEHLKRQYAKDFLELLQECKMPIFMAKTVKPLHPSVTHIISHPFSF